MLEKKRLSLWLHLLCVSLLGFASGFPFPLTSGTLSAWLTEQGYSLQSLGYASFLGMPYLLKWMWAPWLDLFPKQSRLGRRRTWIVGMQLSLAVLLWTMGGLSPAQEPRMLWILAFAVACASASQDIAIDAHRAEILSSYDRAHGFTGYSLGYRIAIVLSGACAFIVAERFGFSFVYRLASVVMVGMIFVTLKSPEPEIMIPQGRSILLPLAELLRRSRIVWLVLFIASFRLCDAFALSLSTPFYMRALGFSLSEIGTVAKGIGLASSFAGLAVGSVLLPRLGLYRMLWFSGLCQALSNLSFLWLYHEGHSLPVFVVTVLGESFFSGMVSAPFVLTLMNWCHPLYTATHYAMFSALAALGRVMIGPSAAWCAEHLGWDVFFMLSVGIGMISLLFLWPLRSTIEASEKISSPSG